MDTSDTIGAAVALGLAVLVRLVLPAGAKRLARGPAILLVLHIIARVPLPLLTEGTSGARLVETVSLVFLLASIGRSSVLLALDGIASRRMSRPMPKIFRDIIQSVVYVALFIVALRTAGVEPGSLLTTSALLTAAIALSLQETLGNLVAGLAIQMQRPFDVDDWIQFDTDIKHIGRVLEINWRATKVITLDDVEIVVPNAALAKASITNFTKPTRGVAALALRAGVGHHRSRDRARGRARGATRRARRARRTAAERRAQPVHRRQRRVLDPLPHRSVPPARRRR